MFWKYTIIGAVVGGLVPLLAGVGAIYNSIPAAIIFIIFVIVGLILDSKISKKSIK